MKRIQVMNINNVVDVADTDRNAILEYVQDIIDDPRYDIPDEVISKENIVLCQSLQSYYANQHSYLTGLWGALRLNAGKDSNRIAVRDYLEGAVSSCKKKYDAASRQLSGYSEIAKDSGMRERPIY